MWNPWALCHDEENMTIAWFQTRRQPKYTIQVSNEQFRPHAERKRTCWVSACPAKSFGYQRSSWPTRRPNPVSVEGWTTLIEDKIEVWFAQSGFFQRSHPRKTEVFNSIKGRDRPLVQSIDERNPFNFGWIELFIDCSAKWCCSSMSWNPRG